MSGEGHPATWYNPRPEITTALIAAGADVSARDPDGHAPPGRATNDGTPLFRPGNHLPSLAPRSCERHLTIPKLHSTRNFMKKLVS